jgi:asparagine synthase (glutamine-hydrolysing)
MFRFVGLVGDRRRIGRSKRHARLKELLSASSDMTCVFDKGDVCVYCSGLNGGPLTRYAIGDEDGVILGVLFQNALDDGEFNHVAPPLDPSVCEAIVKSDGRVITASYWGRYVAFVRNVFSNKVFVLQDPSAGISVYTAAVDDVTVFFSDVADYSGLSNKSLAVNWRYVTAHAVVPVLYPEATGLEEIQELHGGQCVEVSDQAKRRLTYWEPAAFAQRPVEDWTVAIKRTRETVRACTHAWVSLFDNVLHQLSGGVDSSIVLSCLATARNRPTVSCLTYFGTDTIGDERPYARVAAEAVSRELFEVEVQPQRSFGLFRKVAPSPRPRSYVSCFQERQVVRIARELGASAITSGSGGDGVFGQIADRLIAVDYVQRHGVRGELWQTLWSVAAVTETSISSVVGASLMCLLKSGRTRSMIAETVPYRKLLSAATIEAALHGDDFEHPWVRRASNLPPAKRRHIAMMSQPIVARSPLTEADEPECVHPLVSQPILELCAAIPTYTLTAHGETRAVARAAFSEDLPPLILASRAKGNPSGYVRDLIAFNLPLLREWLLDGELVRHGVVDRARLEAALSDRPTDVSPAEILYHASTEAWIHSLGRAQATPESRIRS